MVELPIIYAANPNLIYLQTTAMTESLYLALFIWAVVYFSEFVAWRMRLAIREEPATLASFVVTGEMRPMPRRRLPHPLRRMVPRGGNVRCRVGCCAQGASI